MIYRWVWKPRMGERDRRGELWMMMVHGAKNSALVRGMDTFEEVVCSRYALRKFLTVVS